MTAAPVGPAIWVTIALGLVFALLAQLTGEGPRSPFIWVQWLLFGLLILGLLRPLAPPLSRGAATAGFLALGWLFGMLYETSLTVDGTGIGGVHPQTAASFILAQGDYVPIALSALAMVRWLGADFRALFWLAMGKSLTEGLIFTGVLTQAALAGVYWVLPLALAYYALAYATFVAMPILLVPRAPIAARPARRRRALWWVAVGFGTALVIRVFWGAVYAPLATRLLGLSANPLP